MTNTAAVPVIEIEITPEMIRAGSKAFYRWQGLEFGEGEDAAVIIFREMILAAPKSAVLRLSCDPE